VLIAFAENGEAIPRYSQDSKPRLFAKAHTSIKLYHLNHSDFVRARINIREMIEKLVVDAKRYFNRLESGDATIDNAYNRTIEQLREMRSENAPFSSFVVAILDRYKLEESLQGVFH